jgi:hypothetical protein
VTRDGRLYAKFDLGMDEHPKIMLLTDKAFRALIESTLYARRQLTDGYLDQRVVERKWGPEVAAELSSNDPERPSWARVEGGWMIHDFAEHQTTTLDIQAKREAGRKGGLAKAERTASTPLAGGTEVLQQNASKRLAKTETETETETRTTSPADTSPAKGKKLPTDWTPNTAHIERASTKYLNLAEQAELFKLHAATHDRHAVNWNAAFTMWLTKAKPGTPPALSPWSKEYHKPIYQEDDDA